MMVNAVVRRAVESGEADVSEDLGQPAITDSYMGHMPARGAEVMGDPEHAWAAFLEGEMTCEEDHAFHVTILR